jgi:N-acetylglucosamine-6-phosphate deacetylase
MVDMRATNAKLRDRATRIVAEIAGASLDEARAALTRCNWRPKAAAAALLGGIEPDEAEQVLARHGGRLRKALEELSASGSPTVAGGTRRLGVAAAYVDGALVQGDVVVAGDEIAAVGYAGPGTGIAIPLLVDAQVNGYAGIDVLSADQSGLEELGRALLRHGVGAYLPTLITSSEASLVAALERLAAVAARGTDGASIAGVHLEGPFLSPERAGAHPVDELRLPDVALLERLLGAGPVRMVTLAPELPGALELVGLCVRRDVVVSLGHSAADAKAAKRAFAAGAGAVTHLFNAMAPPSARSPGLAGAALADPDVVVQLIADGVHVSDELLRVAFAAAAGRSILVSDAISAATLPDGAFSLGSVAVEVRGGVARRLDGTLAGSTARLTDGLARLAAIGIDQLDAVAAVTERPARLLGDPALGRLRVGGRADLLVLDETLAVERVLSRGRELEPKRA